MDQSQIDEAGAHWQSKLSGTGPLWSALLSLVALIWTAIVFMVFSEHGRLYFGIIAALA